MAGLTDTWYAPPDDLPPEIGPGEELDLKLRKGAYDGQEVSLCAYLAPDDAPYMAGRMFLVNGAGGGIMRYEAETGDFLLGITGESLICRKISVFREERFLKLRDLLRGADVTFGNAECLFQDYSDPPNTYAGGGSLTGTYMAAPPECIDELKWMGIDMVATANNHASDFGDAGFLTNLRYLDQYGMVHAGTGANLTEACAPGYLESPKGRVALVASADWGPRGSGGQPWPFPMGVMAGEQAPYFRGRPGCNLIRHRPRFTVPREVFDALKRMSTELRFQPAPPESDTELTFMGSQIVQGEGFDLSTVAEAEDLERNYRWVRDARRNADWVLVSVRSPVLPMESEP